MNSEEMEQLKANPRAGFNRAIRDRDVASCLVKTAEIHGHYCPGSAFGVMATLMGLETLGGDTSQGMEDLMAIVEINACFADGVQAVSGCTLGNNALVFRDLGKMAVTFARRDGQNAVRVSIKGRIREHVDEVQPEFFLLMEKVIMARQGSPEEEKAFREKGRQAAFALIDRPFDTYFKAASVKAVLPPYAPIVPSLVCPGCGETVMGTKTVLEGDKKGYCLTCAGALISGVDGRGIGREFF
ncbi:FmdE family protein [Desulfobacter curvatus]|uniref:FmdE family protein n=1 Tax=Desulfobacter curvatus TaxID=2290 RepID=UPI00035CF1A9|nr:FmdE family protein [Desulfobacter curvatus]